MRQEQKSKSSHYDIHTGQVIPVETYGIEGIYILLSEAHARRLDVEAGEWIKITRDGGSIHARVEVETDLTEEALPPIAADDLLRYADHALFSAKKRDRNQVCNGQACEV